LKERKNLRMVVIWPPTRRSRLRIEIEWKGVSGRFGEGRCVNEHVRGLNGSLYPKRWLMRERWERWGECRSG
jgi:hypothetical protein